MSFRAALAAYPPGPHPAAHAAARALGRLCHARWFLAEARERYRQAAGYAPTAAVAADDLCAAALCAQVAHDSGGAFDLLLAAAERAGPGDARAIAYARAIELACRCPATFATEVPYETLRALQADALANGNTDESGGGRPAGAGRRVERRTTQARTGPGAVRSRRAGRPGRPATRCWSARRCRPSGPPPCWPATPARRTG